MKRILLVGLDEPEYRDLKARTEVPLIFHPSLPTLKVSDGELWTESRVHPGRMLTASAVVYHGIFDDDFDFLEALALWGGPCLPGSLGLMRCRKRIPCLAQALRVTRYGAARRGYLFPGQSHRAEERTVAKWGNRHCGENKEQFTGAFSAAEPTALEPFFDGEAVRVVLVGDRAWQIRLEGDDWLKSIHHPAAAFMPIDPALLADTRALAGHFGLEIVGVDYIAGPGGDHHLLEVNHIPNVTVFPEIREAFLELAARWIGDLSGA